MAVQHCHQWALIPIYFHLCGTNPSVHSWTIKGNHRLVRRTTAACHNRLSNEALTGYQSQNKERAAGLWKPNLLNKKLHNTAYESGHPYSIILRDGSILKNICGGAARTTFLCFSKTSVKEIGAKISFYYTIFAVDKIHFKLFLTYQVVVTTCQIGCNGKAECAQDQTIYKIQNIKIQTTTDDQEQLNWPPDVRVKTGAHRTGTERSLQDHQRSAWQQSKSVALTKTMTWWMTRHGREGREKGMQWERAGIFSHITLWIDWLVWYGEFNLVYVKFE